jgi:AcrR family transcriptional regulator
MPRRRGGQTGVQLGEDVVRAMVLQGAAKAFAARGVRQTRIEDILEASRISRRTFYRAFGNKEEVLLALYRIGTERLLGACRTALEEESDPLVMIERCVDAHLQTAREQTRLVFVLGGEAHRYESLLHARRIEVHQTLAAMLAARARENLPHAPDVMLFRGLLLALEGVTRIVLEEGDEGRDVSEERLERARAVMLRMATATIAGEGPGVTPMPEAEASPVTPGGQAPRHGARAR